MVKTERSYKPTAANDAIGGIPNIHYFDFDSKGRGQVVRLLWEDAGIAYDDTRYTFDEYYAGAKESKVRKMNPLGTFPVVELNGQMLIQSYAIVRRMANQLNAYNGHTVEEKYWVDAMSDVASDWRTRFVDAYFNDKREETYPKHIETTRKNFMDGLEAQLNSHDLSLKGAYVIGETCTFADFVIYQVCHDEQLLKDNYAGLKGYPRLAKLCEAVESRPKVKAFRESSRYRG